MRKSASLLLLTLLMSLSGGLTASCGDGTAVIDVNDTDAGAAAGAGSTASASDPATSAFDAEAPPSISETPASDVRAPVSDAGAPASDAVNDPPRPACTTLCQGGDGCCPDGCNRTTDSDCRAVCGNGIPEPPDETCDGNCPTLETCKPKDACHDAFIRPGQSDCDVECVQEPVTTCSGHGACVVRDDRVQCDCDDGWLPEGRACIPDPCRTLSCKSKPGFTVLGQPDFATRGSYHGEGCVEPATETLTCDMTNPAAARCGDRILSCTAEDVDYVSSDKSYSCSGGFSGFGRRGEDKTSVRVSRKKQEAVPCAQGLSGAGKVETDGQRLFVLDYPRLLVWNSLPAAHHQPANLVLLQPSFHHDDLEHPTPRGMYKPRSLCRIDSRIFVLGGSNDGHLLGWRAPTATFEPAGWSFWMPDDTIYQLYRPSACASSGGRMIVNTSSRGHQVFHTTPHIQGFGRYAPDAKIYADDSTALLMHGTKIFIAVNHTWDGASIRVYNDTPSDPRAAPAFTLTHFERAAGMHIDGRGRFYVADSDDGAILIWNQVPTSDRSPDRVLRAPDSGDIRELAFRKPTGVTSLGNKLVIADSGNQRVVIMPLP